MTVHIRLPKSTWLLALMILLLLSAHLLVPYFLSHTAISAALFSSLVIVVVLKHLGLLAIAVRPLYARFRRNLPSRRTKRSRICAYSDLASWANRVNTNWHSLQVRQVNSSVRRGR